MAIVEVKVPQLSESVSEATMLQWKKRPGEYVAQDEILIEIETDKVVLEVPAPAAGVLAQVIRQDGDTVAAEEVIAKIDTEAKASTSAVADATPAAAPAAAVAAAAPAAVAAAPAADQARAMPSAAKLMSEQGLSAGQVSGTGRDGRITKGDVLQAGQAPAAPARAAAPAPAAAKAAAPKASLPDVKAPVNSDEWLEGRPEQRVPMSRLRARVAQRLLESQQTNAILTTFNEVNMQPVMDLRSKYKDKFEKEHGVKLGFMSFFVKAAVHALKKYPVVNASVDGWLKIAVRKSRV